MSKNNQSAIKELFDTLSNSYNDRKTSKNPFLSYFNAQRLSLSAVVLPNSPSSVLDLGAGTGFLYDYLLEAGLDTSSYLALDLSSKMLEQSSIPINQRLVGSLAALQENEIQGFDFIFCLGLTTYLSDAEMDMLPKLCMSKLKGEGQVIISFTNRSSLNHYSRTIIKKLIPKRFLKNKVLGLKPQRAERPSDACGLMIDSGFKIDALYYLNQTIFPFNWLFPRLSVRIANRVKNHKSARLKWWSSDVLIIASRA